jgi:hypothetical protein
MLMPAACMPRAWYSVGMKKPLTVTEFARIQRLAAVYADMNRSLPRLNATIEMPFDD